MDALLNTADRRSAQRQRDYALLLFLYNSGVRASEAVKIRIADLDWHANGVLIIGKDNKQRGPALFIFLGPLFDAKHVLMPLIFYADG